MYKESSFGANKQAITLLKIETPDAESLDRIFRISGYGFYVVKANYANKDGACKIHLNDVNSEGIELIKGQQVIAPFEMIRISSGTLKCNEALQPGLILAIFGSPGVRYSLHEQFQTSDFTVDVAKTTSYEIEGAVMYIEAQEAGNFVYSDREGASKTIAALQGQKILLQPTAITSANAIDVVVHYQRANV